MVRDAKVCFILTGQLDDLHIFNSLLQSETYLNLVIKSLIGHFPAVRLRATCRTRFNLVESREAVEKRSQTRAMQRWSRQDESVRLVAQEQRGLIAAAKDARVDAESVKLPALTWNEEVD
jgi:hypothetical protein